MTPTLTATVGLPGCGGGAVTARPVVLAVVGTRHFANRDAWRAAEPLIDELLHAFQTGIDAECGRVVSGGAQGVDSLVRRRAAEGFGWTIENGKFVECLPEHPRWEPRGYKARNLLIAQTCTHLVRIACPLARTYGSGWTADRAAELGKDVLRYVWAEDAGGFAEQGCRP